MSRCSEGETVAIATVRDCAIGRSGQMGLDGKLPWEVNRQPEYKADVARFFHITHGHVLAAGPKTIASVPDFARADRDLFVLCSQMNPQAVLAGFAGRIVFMGGPPVWDAYALSSAIGT
jgi:dihydromethanopterin reductase